MLDGLSLHKFAWYLKPRKQAALQRRRPQSGFSADDIQQSEMRAIGG
jgi:hypothetical protein